MTPDGMTLTGEAEDYMRALGAVEVLHSKRTFNGDGYGWAVCAECRQAWPCATVEAIDSALGIERYRDGNVKPRSGS